MRWALLSPFRRRGNAKGQNFNNAKSGTILINEAVGAVGGVLQVRNERNSSVNPEKSKPSVLKNIYSCPRRVMSMVISWIAGKNSNKTKY